jgi:protein tyrosine phosphatase (PTP) superfamily phosphohydrolase (DUF442 family)
MENLGPNQLTSHDLQIITGNTTQITGHCPDDWEYEERRRAQAITDFLYLGPTSVVRDHSFLQRAGITMILVVRPEGSVHTKPVSVEKTSKELGIPVQYIYVREVHDLIRAFDGFIQVTNDHLLSVYRSQSAGTNGEGQITVPSNEIRRGKVLATCESGNHWSATMVAAYLMSVCRNDMVHTVQFMSCKRFSCVFDDDVRHMLQSWQDILMARRNVSQNQHGQVLDHETSGHNQAMIDANTAPARKRRLDAMVELDYVGSRDDGKEFVIDADRFIQREPFAPFADADALGNTMAVD